MDAFYKKNMEPGGAVCLAYVKKNSPNHKIMQKLASVTKESDEAIWGLQIGVRGCPNGIWNPWA